MMNSSRNCCPQYEITWGADDDSTKPNIENKNFNEMRLILVSAVGAQGSLAKFLDFVIKVKVEDKMWHRKLCGMFTVLIMMGQDDKALKLRVVPTMRRAQETCASEGGGPIQAPGKALQVVRDVTGSHLQLAATIYGDPANQRLVHCFLLNRGTMENG